MSDGTRTRSAKAAEASRRNGAKSRGPRTIRGKAQSAANSIKHGLFSASLADGGPLPPSAQALADALGRGSVADMELARLAVFAEGRLAHATSLIEELDEEIELLTRDTWYDSDTLELMLTRRNRIGRYQRRFRGQRDRALRRMTQTTGPVSVE